MLYGNICLPRNKILTTLMDTNNSYNYYFLVLNTRFHNVQLYTSTRKLQYPIETYIVLYTLN